MIMGVDIETYSSVDLAKAGVRPYTEAPDFTILLIGYKVDDRPTRIIDLTGGAGETITFLPVTASDLPAGDLDEFLCLLTAPEVTKTAYNAAFERTCLAQYFDCPMPPEQWRCTMVQAATLGLPGTLAQVGAALGLEKQKMEEGKELIRYFCKPTKDGVRRYPADAPEKWELFRRYNIRDVDVETDIRERLSRWPRPQAELDAWALDQRINDRGVRLDVALVDQALKLDAEYSARLKDEAQELTGLPNPKSDSQLKGWLAGRGLVTDSLDKEAIPALLTAAQDDTTRRVLMLRQEMGKTSVKKYEAMARGLCRDGRVHNLLQFYGAGRTGRWAGRLVQVQNLPQNKLPDLETARGLVRNGEFDLLELAYGSPPFVLSQLIRTAFIPSEGCRFIVCDYSAIEARVLAWLAGEKWVLQEFYGDGLIYEATASMMFHVPKDDIKKGGPRADLRSKGKVATLACGYKTSIASQTYDKVKLSYENKDTGKREIFIAQDGSSINQWGVLQYYEKIDSTANAKAMADALLSLYNTKTRTLKLKDVLGDVRVRAGTMLVVMLGLGDMNLSSYLMVEQVKHTFSNEQHVMDLNMRGGTFVA